MRARLDELFLAASLLTRLPVPAAGLAAAAALGRAVWAYPVIGVGLGAAGGAVYAGAQICGAPPLLSAFLALGALALLTGAFHEDGLADFADGVGGGQTREEKLRIMSDSRIGTYGVVALLLSFAIRAAALAGFSPLMGLFALIATGALGRGLIALPLLLLPPAKPGGLGAVAAAPPKGAAGLGLGIGAGAILLFPGPGAIWALATAVLAVLLVARLARWHLGGYTGDALGATEQAGETAALAVLAVAA